jgi:hypothetical protein
MLMVMTPWKNIRLELSPTDGFPAGSVSRAYLLKLPLNDEDRVDRDAVRLSPNRATVRRHWASEPDQTGKIRLGDEEFDLVCEGAASRVLKLDGQPLRLGQQLLIVDADGTSLPFRVASIR